MANEIRVRSAALSGVIEIADELAAGETTWTHSAFSDWPAIDGTQHMAVVLDPRREAGAPEVVYITAHTAASDDVTIARGQEGTTDREHLVDVEFMHAPTLRDYPRAPIQVTKQSGDTTLTTPTANAWTDVDSGIDITVPHCYAGDYVSVGLSALLGSAAVSLGFDAHSIVSAAAVNSWSYDAAVVEGADATRYGTNGWWCTGGQEQNIGASIQKMLLAGDLNAGTLTLRLRYKPSANTPDRTFYSSLASPFHWWAHNTGPKVVWL